MFLREKTNTLSERDLFISFGVLIARGRINKTCFRELCIWLFDSYPDLPFSEQTLDDDLATWILEDCKATTSCGIYRMFPNYWITEAHDRTICIYTIFDKEAQKEILYELLCLEQKELKRG